ncbi:hypothetical protein E4T56_gene10121 [Termitomyces sp. T112]|nr:hypothetical protein E4T56_gene10121 [Termitomyces sp. T112]
MVRVSFGDNEGTSIECKDLSLPSISSLLKIYGPRYDNRQPVPMGVIIIRLLSDGAIICSSSGHVSVRSTEDTCL